MFNQIFELFGDHYALCLDLDGTLIEKGAAIHFVAAQIAYSMLGHELTLEDARTRYLNPALHGQDWFYLMSKGRTEAERLSFAQQMKGVFDQVIQELKGLNIEKAKVFNGVPEFLEQASQKIGPNRIAIVTAKPTALAKLILESLDLDNHVQHYVGCEFLYQNGVITKKSESGIWNQAKSMMGLKAYHQFVIAEDGHDGGLFATTSYQVKGFIAIGENVRNLPRKNYTNCKVHLYPTKENDWTTLYRSPVGV